MCFKQDILKEYWNIKICRYDARVKNILFYKSAVIPPKFYKIKIRIIYTIPLVYF
jgi:hypothetical protein